MLKRTFAYQFIFMTYYVNYQKYLDIHSCNQLQKGGKIGYLNLYLASKQAVAVGWVQSISGPQNLGSRFSTFSPIFSPLFITI